MKRSSINIIALLVFLLTGTFVVAADSQNIILDDIGKRSNIPGAQSASRDDTLRVLAKDAAPAGNSAVVGAKQVAAGQRALDLGKKALESNETDKALLYFINGVNHDPSRMELIQKLAEAALKSGSNELGERVVGILELATMQVAPDDMQAVLDRIAELRAKIAPPPPPKLSPEVADERIKDLYSTYAPDAIWSDAEKVANGLSEIEFFQQMIDGSRADDKENRYSKAIRKSIELATSLQRIQGSLPLYQHVKACLVQMDAVVQTDPPDIAYFDSLGASAQGVLVQIWGGINELPTEMQKELLSFPAKIRTITENLQDKTSTAPYDSAVELLKRTEANRTGNFTTRIKRITESLDKVAILADKITSGKLRLQLFEKIRKIRDGLVMLELERRAVYQTWALERVNGFMVDWNNNMTLSDKEAKVFYRKHGIARIDETLIVPEVARVLTRVMNCIFGKLDAKGGSEAEYQMAASSKKRLEDF
jgi:hypothetical protein